MRRPLTLALACSAALSASGCGLGSDSDTGTDPNDKRAAALECLREEKGLKATPEGDDAIRVGSPLNGSRIRFFLTTGEAEARQFEGREEGTEHIGAALLYVRQASEAELEEVEACLDDL